MASPPLTATRIGGGEASLAILQEKQMNVLRTATHVATLTHQLTEGLPKRGLVDQVRRAADSIVLNLAEGRGYRGRMATKYFRIAHGSCQEAKAAVELLAKRGSIQLDAGRRLWLQLDEVGAMTWGLIR